MTITVDDMTKRAGAVRLLVSNDRDEEKWIKYIVGKPLNSGGETNLTYFDKIKCLNHTMVMLIDVCEE